ncbi:hypothetical protein NEMBOFW57_008934 [Staphylotrichum longicolle]|uniref:Uncharacterized protein n=1 Tax=Staphylotrichum longicolle TaxID=669026 RepID=A0AAD4HZB8_9PEZI|nr:hypothetical protein NEMBOFW57_008934 [Staphylotrichum longicolle]
MFQYVNNAYNGSNGSSPSGTDVGGTGVAQTAAAGQESPAEAPTPAASEGSPPREEQSLSTLDYFFEEKERYRWRGRGGSEEREGSAKRRRVDHGGEPGGGSEEREGVDREGGAEGRERHHHHHRRHRHRHHPAKRESAERTSSGRELPFAARQLSRSDLVPFKPLFAHYLDLQKTLDITSLDETELRGRWKSFMGKWNRGELAEGWYDPEVFQRAARDYSDAGGGGPTDREYSSRRSPPPGPAAGPSPPNRTGQNDQQDEPESDSDFGPPHPHLWQSDLTAHRQARVAHRREQRALLDELVPRADAGTRERRLEKRKEVNEKMKGFRERSPGAEVGEGELMGGSGDTLEEYKAMVRVREEKKKERVSRREEEERARRAEREERVRGYREREERVVEGLRELARREDEAPLDLFQDPEDYYPPTPPPWARARAAEHRGGGARARQVVVTDFPDPDLVETMWRNVRGCELIPRHTNKDGEEDVKGIVVEGYVWGADPSKVLSYLPEEKGEGGFDVLILADLLFRHTEHGNMLKTVRATLKKAAGSRAWVVFTSYRPWLQHKDLKFFDLAREEGFVVEKVLEKKMDRPLFEKDPGDEEVLKTVTGWTLRWPDEVLEGVGR